MLLDRTLKLYFFQKSTLSFILDKFLVNKIINNIIFLIRIKISLEDIIILDLIDVLIKKNKLKSLDVAKNLSNTILLIQ